MVHESDTPHEADVVVFGAGPAGIAAAVTAARESLRVTLVEVQDRIGGVMASCPGMMLGSGYPCGTSVGGFFEEFVGRLYDNDPPLAERRSCGLANFGDEVVYDTEHAISLLYDLLSEAGVHADADQIVGRSSDGMTIGTPTAVIMDGRDAMLAIGMNDEPLPIQHGFPVRMLVPGLYGYVSATKWLVDLQATTFADYDTYWVQRRWAAQAPIRLESRIDTPKPFASLTKGQLIKIGGVAWHQHTGIKSVEVQINDEPWREAVLGRVPSTDTWVQWSLPWTVNAQGPVSLRVRAIDSNGVMQDQTRREPFPSGASGWHTVVVQAG